MRRRGRFLVGVLWFTTAFCLGFGLIYLSLGWWPLAGIVLALLPFGPLGVWLLWRRGALVQAENLLLVTGFLMVGGLIVVTGGAQSPAQGWLVFLPILGLSGVSGRVRFEAVAVPLVFLGGLHLGAALGWPLPYRLPEGTEPTISAIATLGLVALMPVWMGLYAQLMHNTLESDALRDAQQHAEEQRRAHDALLKAAQARQRMLSAVSHQLRTPLHGILGCAALLDSAPEGARPRLGQDIARSGQELLGIVEHMLAISAPDGAAAVPQRPAPVVLRAALQRAVAAAGLERRASISVDAPLDEPVLIDPVRLTRLLALLLDNCAQHAPGAAVRLHASSPTAGMAVLTIADDGPGLPADVLAAEFAPFVVGGDTPADRPGSLGLGLWHARQLAQGLGGAMVHQPAARGTTFRLTLPCARAPSRPEPVSPMRLLVVEDNPINRRMLQLLLQQQGHTVHQAANGAEAVSFFTEGGRAALVLMDCQMPVMDGLEATRQLRARGFTVPIVALTAHTLPEQRDACLEAGMDDFIAKPTSTATLQGVLRQHGVVSGGAGAAAAGDLEV